MLKIKILTVILLGTMALVFSGCAEKRIILIPSTQYYPTFKTTDFHEKGKYPLTIHEESEEINGTTYNYLVGNKKDILDYIENSKQTRSDYNLLLKSIKNFNTQIEEQNKIQSEKEPQEIK